MNPMPKAVRDKTPRLCAYEKCIVVFVPKRKVNTYCSVRCANRDKREPTKRHKPCALEGCNNPVYYHATSKNIRKYCSRKCANRDKWDPKRHKPCALEGCNNPVYYHPAVKDIRKYCSRKCAGLARRVVHKRKCVQCGRAFLARIIVHGKKKLCSRKCVAIYVGEKNRKFPTHGKCPVCKKTFRFRRHHTKHCSVTCSSKDPQRNAKISLRIMDVWYDRKKNANGVVGLRKNGIRRTMACIVLEELGVTQDLIETTKQQYVPIKTTPERINRLVNLKKGDVAIAMIKELGSGAVALLDRAVDQVMKGEAR